MAFIAKNPIVAPETNSPLVPPQNTRAIFPKDDGWYEIDDNGNVSKLIAEEDAVGKKTEQGGEVFNDYKMNTASGNRSHAEGYNTTAKGYASHTEGSNAIASGYSSHAEGFNTKASGEYQHVQGKYNKEDTQSKYANIVGNGSSNSYRSNAHTLDWDGNAWYQGTIKVGGTGYDDTNAKEVATKEYVDNSISSAGGGDMLKSVYDKDKDGVIDDVALMEYYGTKNITISPESYFTVNETGETITGLTNTGKTQTELVIPYKINSKEITNIGGDAFEGCKSLKSITIPNSVTNIGGNAFYNCTSLKSITIPNSVTSISDGAFQNCKLLTSINIPNSITSIGGGTFYNCAGLSSIDIPNSVTSIEMNAFGQCASLISINIPSSVKSIGDSAFHVYSNDNWVPIPGLTIYCEQGSYAESYAKTNNIPIMYTNIDSSKYLTKDNIIEYTPLADYQPATKKYVDDINTVASEETCTLSEPLTLTVVSSDGWTGDLTNGFTHINDNTNNLVFSLGEDTGDNIYQVTFNSSVDATNTNITVTVGDSEPFLLYGMPQPYSVGIKSVSNGNVKFIPESTFTGTISNITVKKIISTVQVNKRSKVTDSRNSVVFEARFSNADTINTSIPHDNIFLGLKSGETNTNGFGNIGLGSKALRNNTSGFWNTGIGFETLLNNTVGSRNVGIGYGTLQKNICGTRNIAIGTFSMINNTTGGWNISIGADNMNNNISGNSNVSIGFQAMYYGISSENNVAVGREALQKITTGSNNTAVGYSSGAGITTGINNMAIGRGSLQYCENGSYNTTIGTNALYGLKNGNYNIAIGAFAGRGTSGTTFKENIFIGSSTGQKIGNNANRNIIIGHASGNKLTTGDYNIIIGAICEVPNETGNYQLNIGDLITGNMATGSKSVTINGTMTINNLPTSDPNVAGQLWNDNGTVKVSVG